MQACTTRLLGVSGRGRGRSELRPQEEHRLHPRADAIAPGRNGPDTAEQTTWDPGATPVGPTSRRAFSQEQGDLPRREGTSHVGVDAASPSTHERPCARWAPLLVGAKLLPPTSPAQSSRSRCLRSLESAHRDPAPSPLPPWEDIGCLRRRVRVLSVRASTTTGRSCRRHALSANSPSAFEHSSATTRTLRSRARSSARVSSRRARGARSAARRRPSQ